MCRHGLTVEAREQAQRNSIADTFGQFTIIPVLNAHQNPGQQHLRGCQPTPSRPRFLQAMLELMIDGFDPFRVLVDIYGDLLQNGFHLNALVAEFQIGKAYLVILDSHADSLMRLSYISGPNTHHVGFTFILFVSLSIAAEKGTKMADHLEP